MCSFVAGVGDPAHLGWVGRLAARAENRGLVLTGYNLGIRLDTSGDARWQREVRLRFPGGLDNRLVLSFGVNDTSCQMATISPVCRGQVPYCVDVVADLADGEHRIRLRQVESSLDRQVPVAPVTVPLPEIQDLQVRIQGSATYTRADYAESMAMINAGLVRPEGFVTAQYPLSEVAAAFDEASSDRQVKVVVLADDAVSD